MEIQLFTNLEGFEDDLRLPVRSSPVKCLPFFNHFVESSDNLLQRSIVVVKMGINNVNVIHLESLKRFLHTLPNVLPVC